MKTSGILDLDRIARLKKLERANNPGFMETVIELYHKTVAEGLVQVRAALENRDSKALYQSAHVLKSTSKTLGATGFSQMFVHLEMVAMDGVFSEPLNEVFTQIEEEYLRVTEALELVR